MTRSGRPPTRADRDEDADQGTGGAAFLVGFPESLETALSVLLTSHHFSVQAIPSVSDAIEQLADTHVDLVLASSRCSSASVVKLTEALGQPRQTRVIVLLAGRDREVERRYRAAGLKYVMTMPVNAEDLLQVAFPPPS